MIYGRVVKPIFHTAACPGPNFDSWAGPDIGDDRSQRMKIYSAFRVSFRAARNNLHAHRDPIKMDYLCVFCLSEGEERDGKINRKRGIQLFSWPSKRVWYCTFNIPVNTGEIWFRVYLKLCGVIDFEIIVIFLIVSLPYGWFLGRETLPVRILHAQRKRVKYFSRPFFLFVFFFFLQLVRSIFTYY